MEIKLADRIVLDPENCAGKPTIKGTLLKVEFILKLLALGWTYDQLVNEYDLEIADILAVLEYAHQTVSGEQIYPATTDQESEIN